MAALIDYLKNDFDFIIVDSPAGIEQGLLMPHQLLMKQLLLLILILQH